jgi:hypothetical protein
MVKDQEEKVQKPPDLPTICTKESTRSGAPTRVMTESINGRLTAFCFAGSVIAYKPEESGNAPSTQRL